MDRSEDSIPPDLSALERRLGQWKPAAGLLDRDRLMFEAGRASARAGRGRQVERAAIAALMLVVLGLSVQLRLDRNHAPSPRPIAAPEDLTSVAVPDPIARPDADSYLALSRRMLAGLGDAPPTAGTREPRHAAPEAADPPLSPLRLRGQAEFLDL